MGFASVVVASARKATQSRRAKHEQRGRRDVYVEAMVSGCRRAWLRASSCCIECFVFSITQVAPTAGFVVIVFGMGACVEIISVHKSH